MEKNKKLERRRFKLKDDKGNYIGSIGAVSIVTTPAIEKSFSLFSDTSKKINFKIADQEKKIIMGPAMVPNIDILRFDDESKEYFMCYFTEQDVRDYMEYFMRYADTRKANIEHEREFFDDFFVAESWIVEDPEKDKSAALGFKDITKGTWMISYKCVNDEKWEEIKNSDLSGFSVEISLMEFESEIAKRLEAIVDDPNLSKEEKRNKIKEIIYK